MSGTAEGNATWAVTPSTVPSWLVLEAYNGLYTSLENEAAFVRATAVTSGFVERLENYQASLRLTITSARVDVFEIPVLLRLSARDSAALGTWGAISAPTVEGAARGSCSSAVRVATTYVLNVDARIPFTSCDMESMPVAHSLPSTDDTRSFTASVTSLTQSTTHAATVVPRAYGIYHVSFEPVLLGDYVVTVKLDGARLAFCVQTHPYHSLNWNVRQATSLVVVGCNSTPRALKGRCLPLMADNAAALVAHGSNKANANSVILATVPRWAKQIACDALRCARHSSGSPFYREQRLPSGSPPEAYYSATRSINGSTATIDCRPCPDGTVCAFDTDVTTIWMRSGYWRLSDHTLDLRECPRNGTFSACLGGTTNGSCIGTQSGPMCKSCVEPSHYYDAEDGFCHECSAGIKAIVSKADFAIAVSVVCALVMVALLLCRLYQYPQYAPTVHHHLSAAMRYVSHKLQFLGLQCKLKVRGHPNLAHGPGFHDGLLPVRLMPQVVVAFLQIVSVLGDTFSVQLPEYFTDWLDVFNIVGLDWESLLLPKGCLAGSFTGRLVITAVAPIIPIFGVWAVFSLRALCSGSNNSSGASSDSGALVAIKAQLAHSLKSSLLSSTPLALLVTFAFSENYFRHELCQPQALSSEAQTPRPRPCPCPYPYPCPCPCSMFHVHVHVAEWQLIQCQCFVLAVPSTAASRK
eukprot:802109-Prymnesium_polylepis.1